MYSIFIRGGVPAAPAELLCHPKNGTHLVNLLLTLHWHYGVAENGSYHGTILVVVLLCCDQQAVNGLGERIERMVGLAAKGGTTQSVPMIGVRNGFSDALFHQFLRIG